MRYDRVPLLLSLLFFEEYTQPAPARNLECCALRTVYDSKNPGRKWVFQKTSRFPV